MSLPVLVGFAGVLVAAVATGLLAGRCVRQPRVGFIVWTAATLGLTIALAAQSMGFAGGFGPATFRAVQLLALLLAPLWLAWGLVAVRAGRDPGSARDSGSTRGAGSARDLGPALTAIALAALAVLMTAGQRFPLPAKVAYPLLSIVAAVLVWFAVSRVGEVPRRAVGDGRGEGMRDRRDKPGDEYWPDDRAAGEYAPEGQYVTYGQDRPGSGGPRGDIPGAPAGRGGSASGGVP